jgi:hypothetical protein
VGNVRKALIAFTAIGTVVTGLVLGTAGPAAAYGAGAQYQVELTANASGPHGGGVWLWIELDGNGTGDYTGSDCGHGSGAVADMGDVTWWSSGGWITIQGVVLNGLEGFPTTITVPATYGHYSGTIGSFLTLPPFIPGNIGKAQLQVAP